SILLRAREVTKDAGTPIILTHPRACVPLVPPLTRRVSRGARAGATQARTSTRWMPRRTRPMKDAETGETFRGSCMQAMSPEIPNGATHPERCLETACCTHRQVGGPQAN